MKFLAGILAGISVFIRPDLLPLNAALFVFFVTHGCLSIKDFSSLAGFAIPLSFSLVHNLYYGGKWVFFTDAAFHASAWFIPPGDYIRAILNWDLAALKMIGEHLFTTITWGHYFHLEKLFPWPAYFMQGIVLSMNFHIFYLTWKLAGRKRWINLLCLSLMFLPWFFWATGGRRLYCAYLCLFIYYCYLKKADRSFGPQ